MGHNRRSWPTQAISIEPRQPTRGQVLGLEPFFTGASKCRDGSRRAARPAYQTTTCGTATTARPVDLPSIKLAASGSFFYHHRLLNVRLRLAG
jgi:hypothetical protein